MEMAKEKMNFIVIIGVSMAMVTGLLFLDTTWALDMKPLELVHPVLGNYEKQHQPSRILYQQHLSEGAAKNPAMIREGEAVVTKMNQLMVKGMVQDLKDAGAFRRQRPVVPEMPTPNPHRIQRSR